MSNQENSNPLQSFSDAMAAAVAKAGAFTVLVSARQRMPASGILYQPEFVLTANHVVEQEDNIGVMLADGSELSAQIAGRDPTSDLAVLRLGHTAGPTAEKAAQDARIGQWVLALGRPSPEGVEASLGVVSAIGGPVRTRRGGLLDKYLRTDTIPYPGFSGGPLIDIHGQVVGVNTSGLTRNAALTIPASLAWQLADSLSAHGHIRRGFLGVRSQPVEIPAVGRSALGREQAVGLLLVGVESDSPAAAGGLMVGDILVGISGEAISDPDQLVGKLSGSAVGKPAPVELLRGGQKLTLSVTIGERH